LSAARTIEPATGLRLVHAGSETVASQSSTRVVEPISGKIEFSIVAAALE
jgi:hypothetical protein